MQESVDKILSVQAKLQKLLKRYAVLQKDHEALQQKHAGLLSEKEQQAVIIEDLQQQNLILKASLDTLDATDKKELEKKLNLYIRNIDKCIEQLSQ